MLLADFPRTESDIQQTDKDVNCHMRQMKSRRLEPKNLPPHPPPPTTSGPNSSTCLFACESCFTALSLLSVDLCGPLRAYCLIPNSFPFVGDKTPSGGLHPLLLLRRCRTRRGCARRGGRPARASWFPLLNNSACLFTSSLLTLKLQPPVTLLLNTLVIMTSALPLALPSWIKC